MSVGWLYDRSVGLMIETALPNQEPQRSRTLTLQATPLIADLQAGITAPLSLPPDISTEIAFSATNFGPDAVSDVTLRYSNPLFEVGAIDAGDGTCDQRGTGSIVCTIERLEAAETYRVGVQTVPRAGTHTAEVTIDSGNRYDPTLANNVVSRSLTSAAPAQNTPSTAPPASGGGHPTADTGSGMSPAPVSQARQPARTRASDAPSRARLRIFMLRWCLSLGYSWVVRVSGGRAAGGTGSCPRPA